MQCGILGYRLAGMCFSSSSRCHMSVMFHVWNAVIYLSTAELKSAMRDSDQGNRGIGSWEWSGMEQNGTEWNRMEQNRTEWNMKNKNKNKGKMQYHCKNTYWIHWKVCAMVWSAAKWELPLKGQFWVFFSCFWAGKCMGTYVALHRMCSNS